MIHLASAAVSYANAVALSPLAGDARFPWTPSLRAEGEAAAQALAEAAGPEAMLEVAREAAGRLSEMIAGIERFQSHPYRRTLRDPPTVWRAGAARLLDYGATAPAGREGVPLLVVPSLVNRAYILDLHPQRSMLRALAQAGLRPLLLDWGAPGPQERGFGLDAYMRRRLIPAAEAARALTGRPPAVLGYCMGGGLSAALAALRPDLCRRLALIGAPWDFEKLSGFGAAMAALFARESRAALRARLDAVESCFGAVPVDVIQTLFAALDPTLALRKFRRLARLPRGGLTEELFVATEDWLNDGAPVTAPAARDLLFDWHLDNLAAKGEWRLGAEPIRPDRIAAPTIAFCSTNDRISPSACAEPLPAAIPGARVLRPSTGHVGMIVGGRAPAQVWRPLTRFALEAP